ncbi:MAG: hypothetical protein ABSH41_32420, partial [Syntrophobacteraceae bacterium]
MALQLTFSYDAPIRRMAWYFKIADFLHDILGKRDFVFVNNKVLVHEPHIFVAGESRYGFFVGNFFSHYVITFFHNQVGLATPDEVH